MPRGCVPSASAGASQQGRHKCQPCGPCQAPAGCSPGPSLTSENETTSNGVKGRSAAGMKGGSASPGGPPTTSVLRLLSAPSRSSTCRRGAVRTKNSA